MKKNLVLILIFLPLTIIGQHLKCCESEKEVESYLSGIWKIKDSDSKTCYKYWFEKGQGNLTEIELTENKGEYLIIDNHPFVDIIKYDMGFKLRFTNLAGNWISELKYLNSKKMILVTDKKEVEYIKVSE
ncbi:hypothetical protein [Aquimarina sp. 2201CG5-10]|uniref:hypothetical protein n=1 Tax=Aquimarina callyspongiae TaxID=3098150 RepID=UPI002AB4DA1E|nr:hypothetical protein [Aquimarina sp. 2201CG5-10]MDY8135445.1 hypothetical protein [Aquimarina sp. 2201CG5-10]